MADDQRPAPRSQWIFEANGVEEEPVPASVLDKWQRYRLMSRSSRRRHVVVEVSSLAVSASIPVLAAFELDARLIAAIGSVAVLINGLRTFGGFKESWASRTRARYQIEKEIALFAAGHSPYAENGAGATLVEAVEEICVTEREGWASLRLSYGGGGAQPPAKTSDRIE